MPATVDAALIFAVLVVPGYLLSQGVEQGRNVDADRPDLHVLAKAVVVSVIWLAITWPIAVEDLVTWVDAETLGEHSYLAAAWRAGVLILLPYLVGRTLGELIERNVAVIAPILRAMRIGTTFGTPWDLAWARVQASAGPVLVTVRLDDGNKLVGQFAKRSSASVSPQHHEVFLEEAYEDDAGQLVIYHQGLHIDGDKIAAVSFQEL